MGENNLFCLEPSQRYLRSLEEAGDDPRSAAGLQALEDLEKFGSWMPAVDARDARRTGPEGSSPSPERRV